MTTMRPHYPAPPGTPGTHQAPPAHGPPTFPPLYFPGNSAPPQYRYEDPNLQRADSYTAAAQYPYGAGYAWQDPSQQAGGVLGLNALDKAKRYEGVVKNYNVASGFGFITCVELSKHLERDIFFNRAIEACERIEAGLQVSFLLEISPQGKPQAQEIKLTGASKKAAQSKIPPPPEDKVFTGVVRTFNGNLGYGFINCTEIKETYDRDVFVHKQQIQGIEIGDQVKFKVRMNQKQQPQARDVEKFSGEATVPFVEPPDGKKKFVGQIHSYNKEQGFGFLDSDEASKKWGHGDVFVHKNYIRSEDLEDLENVTFEFDVLMVKSRPQARNLRPLSPEDQAERSSTQAPKTDEAGSPQTNTGKDEAEPVKVPIK